MQLLLLAVDSKPTFHIFLLACLDNSYIHVTAVLTTECGWHLTIVTSGFRRDVNEICALWDFM
jgi:hypothetical protein